MATRHQAGAGWVHVRPLRPPHPTGDTSPPTPPTRQPTQEAVPRSRSSAAAGRPQARSSSPAPTGAALRALQLDPDPARRHKPAATRNSHNHSPPPNPAAGEQVTRSVQHAHLTTGAPMGATMTWRTPGRTAGFDNRRSTRSIRLPKRHADHRPEQAVPSHRPHYAQKGSLPSRNTGQIQFGLTSPGFFTGVRTP
jgi:hypothetical protein